MATHPDIASANRQFSARLAVAADRAQVPPLHKGRLAWMHEHLGVSREAARKWFAGETMPRRSLMKNIANILKVDEAWLGLGVGAPATDPVQSNTQAFDDNHPSNSSESIDYDTASDQLKLLVDNATVGKSTIIDRGGQPEAVVISFKEWQRLSNIPSFGRLLMEAPFDASEFAPRLGGGLRMIDF